MIILFRENFFTLLLNSSRLHFASLFRVLTLASCHRPKQTMATVSTAPAPGMHQIDLSKLNLQQLAQLKQRLDQEMTVFQDSLHTLKIAHGKFMESGECVEKITPDTKGKTILVPLTGSMYVPGSISDTDNVMIDIGTGYYAQKDIEGAKDYFKRKVAFVSEQMEKIKTLGSEKSKVHKAICMMIEMKFQAQMQAGKANAS